MSTQSTKWISPPEETVHPQTTIREAMARMTEHHQGLLPVVDMEGKLLGIVADGDIRRGLLAGVSLDDDVTRIANRMPIVAGEDAEQHEIDALMRSSNKTCVPVVDKKGRFQRLAFLERPLIFNCVPSIAGREQAYVAEAIAGGWLAVGPFIEQFEKKIANFVGARHAVATVNGTAALHLALVVAGVKAGDLVLMPTTTFAATANAVCYTGARPMFFDVDPVSWCLDAVQVARYLEEDCERKAEGVFDRASGARIGAILPVHVYGHPADMDAFSSISERFGIPVVEDGAEALGARYRGRMVGSDSLYCALSFNGNKIITSGGGGMVLTNDAAVSKKLRYLASQAKDDPVDFVHGDVGFNYRMPNINAALAMAQAEKLEEFIARKRRFVQRYGELLADIPGVSMWKGANWADNSFWMAVLTVDPDMHPQAISSLRRFLPSRGIEARPVWSPLHRQKPYAAAPHQEVSVGERIYQTSLCLPCSTGLTSRELETTARALVEFFTLYR